MTKEGVKHKTKKSNIPPKPVEFDTFLKNQEDIVSKLKTTLKSVISEAQSLDNGTVEKEDKILKLEQNINQRDAEIHKLNSNLDQLKEENSKILLEFTYFKEKFYQLETNYDRTLNIQNDENENLRAQLQNLKTADNQIIENLSLKCQDLQQTLQDKINELTHLNKLQDEILRKYEQLEINFEREQKEFELYKNQVIEDKRNEEKIKLDFDNLKDELRKKDEIIKQCNSDKNALEKEKNLVIDELNNKICRIERAFSQPTKAVQPVTTLQQEANNSDNISSSEGSIGNTRISNPLARKPLESSSVQPLSSIENKIGDQNQMQRDHRFKRPAQLTSTQQSNVNTNRKRQNQSLRQSSVRKHYDFSSSDEDDDNTQLWRPNPDFYVPDTDESGGFLKSKRSKK